MKWNKPKALINKVLLLFSVVSLLMAVFWFSIYYIWNNNPQKINEYSLSIKNEYSDYIERLHTRTKKGKSPEDTFKRLQIYVKALKGITPLHKYYNYYSEVQNEIIDYLIKNKQLNKAKQYAKNWAKQYENDFHIKYKLIEVLQQSSQEETLAYYEKVFTKHNDIYEFSQKYIDYLISQGKIRKAEEVAKIALQKNRTQKKGLFMLYYTDSKHKKYNSESRIVIADMQHQKSDNSFNMQTEFSVKGLKKIRFDIDSQEAGAIINKLTIGVKTQGKTYANLKLKPLHSIKAEDNNYVITGKDPYFEVLLPQEIINTTEKIKLIASLQIQAAQLNPMQSLTNDKEWQFFYAHDASFNEENSTKFSIEKNQKFYQAQINIKPGNYQYIRFDLPTIKNLILSELTITSQRKTLDLNDYKLVHLNKTDNGRFKVASKDPYIIINLQKPELLERISLSFKLDAKQ